MRGSEMRDCGFIIMPVRKEQQPQQDSDGALVSLEMLFFFMVFFLQVILLPLFFLAS